MSVIMGSLPFQYETVLDLWKKKVGLEVKPFVVSQAVQDGMDLEPEARERYTAITGIQVEPRCFTHPHYPFLRASLDGYGISLELERVAVEIKCPMITSFKKALKGQVLDYYYTQIQQQIACSGVVRNDYWVYRKEEGGVLMRAKPNEEYIAEIVRRGQIFWDMVESKKPCLPRHLGINMQGYSDPFKAGDMSVEFIGIYPNEKLKKGRKKKIEDAV